MSSFIAARDLRAGQTIIWNDEPCLILDHSFNKTAMRGGIVKCKIKNLFTGSITTEDFSNKKLARANINKTHLAFTYSDDSFLYFMDNTTFEEIKLEKKNYVWETNFLEEGVEINVSIFEGRIIALNLPDVVTLSIQEIMEENASAEHKKAITKTGLVVFVPKFFKDSKTLTVSTADGKYKSR